MKFYQLPEVPFARDDKVFRISPLRSFIPLSIIGSITIGALLLAAFGKKWFQLQIPSVVLYFVAAFLFLFDWLIYLTFRAALRPSNWLLRCNASGVLLKYRSILNWKFPVQDVQVVGLDFSEIAWVRTAKERRLTSDLEGKSFSQSSVYLDIGLINLDTVELEKHLQTEINLKSDGHILACEYPVQVVAGGIVRVTWRQGGTGLITPSAKEAVKCLGRFVKIADPVSDSLDLTFHRDTKPEEIDAKILTLLKGGNHLAAIALARRMHKSSLTEASAYVESLASKNS